MKVIKGFSGLFVIIAFFLVLFVGCTYYGGRSKAFYIEQPGTAVTGSIDFSKTSIEQIVQDYVNHEMERTVTIASTGDLKFYEWQLKRSYSRSTGTYDFMPEFQYVQSYTQQPDLLIGNIETTIAGKNNGNDKSVNGYGANRDKMIFNTPDEIAKNLADVGYDIIVTANEHAFDSGTEGLKRTKDVLTSEGLECIGTRSDTSEAYGIIKVVQGIKIGLIAYTTVINSDLSSEQLALVNYLNLDDQKSLQQVQNDIESLKTNGAQAIVVQLHSGEEYKDQPDEKTTKLCDAIAKAGADIIFGVHPHVPQPLKYLSVKQQNGDIHKCLVVYSMGNFLTSQQFKMGSEIHRDLGMMCEVVLKKEEDIVSLSAVNILPVFSNWNDTTIASIPAIEAASQPQAFKGILDSNYRDRVNEASEKIFPDILNKSGLKYTVEDNMYKISLEN